MNYEYDVDIPQDNDLTIFKDFIANKKQKTIVFHYDSYFEARSRANCLRNWARSNGHRIHTHKQGRKIYIEKEF